LNTRSDAVYPRIQLLHGGKYIVINKLLGFVHDQHSFRRVNDYVPLKSDVKGDGNKKNRMPKYLLTAFDH